jgi:hypothetical protein
VSVLVAGRTFASLAVATRTIKREITKRARATGLIRPRVTLTADSIPGREDAYQLKIEVAAAGRVQGDRISLFDADPPGPGESVSGQ